MRVKIDVELTLSRSFKPINVSGLFRFKQLQHLWLEDVNQEFYSFNGFDSISIHNTSLPIQHLHLYFRADIAWLLKFCPYLKTLDMLNNDYLFSPGRILTVQDLRGKPLQILKNQEFKVLSQNFFRPTELDFDRFGTSFADTLEYLDFSYCHISIVTGNIFTAFPNLKLLDLSHNQLAIEQATSDQDLSFINVIILAMMVHPQLEVLHFSHQISPEISDVTHDRSKRTVFFNQHKYKFDFNLLFGDGQAATKYRQNLVYLLFNVQLPVLLMPSIHDLINASRPQCDPYGMQIPLQLPTAPNMKRLNFGATTQAINSYYIQQGSKEEFTLCFKSKNIKSLDFSRTNFLYSVYFHGMRVTRLGGG